MRKRKDKKGSAIAFGASLALVIIVLGLGFVAFTMYMGGQNETKNAVDAGALNLGRQVIDNVFVNLSTAENQQFFKDVTSNLDGKVNLRNINRVWAKALLVAVNSDAAGQYKGDTASNVDNAWQGASDISDALAAKLTDPTNLYNYFSDFADKNSVRMIGAGATITRMTGAGWQTSLMDRKDESNLQQTDNLPIGYTLKPGSTTPCTRSNVPPAAAGMQFLQGYVPLHAGQHTFWQVPFQYDEKPHLVSQTPFNANKQPPNSLPEAWAHPVPNAFSVQGQTNKAGVGEQAMSWVQTNPRQPFQTQFPNGFVRIILKQNTIQWNIDGIPADSATYAFEPGDDAYSGDGIPYPFVPICASGSGDCSTGNEYTLPFLYFAICGAPFPDETSDFMQYLLQRCKEMLPGASMSDLRTALMACMISSDDADQTFYLYPVAGHLIATPDSVTNVPVGCDKSSPAEGNPSQTMATTGPNPLPNLNAETWVCLGETTPDIPMLCFTSIERSWKPGTGYPGGCLGELTVHHKIDATVMTLVCSCP